MNTQYPGYGANFAQTGQAGFPYSKSITLSLTSVT